MQNKNFKLSVVIAAAMVLGLAVPGAAKDAVKAGVTIPAGQPAPLITANGNPYAQGTFAIGTIQLLYTVTANSFPAGAFATFNVNLEDFHVDNAGQEPVYPTSLELRPLGSPNVTLSPAPSLFSVSGHGWAGSSLVTVSIPASVAADPDLNFDGSIIVGNLALVGGRHLDTPTNIQVKILLVHPTACIKIYNFVSNEDFTIWPITSVAVNKNNGNGNVTGTSPTAQRDNILVANLCGTDQFDLKVTLDPDFQLQSAGNPVKTYTASGEISPSSFVRGDFSGETNHGTNVCLVNLTVPGSSTLLATAHMRIKSVHYTTLGPSPFEFTGALYTAGSTCSGTAIHSATANVSYIIP